jgi:predicted Zn-dependent protease with MMP-like domain
MVRMDPAEFDKLVERAMRSIPGRFRKRLKNLVFIVEPEPPVPNLLGLYQGYPMTHRGVSDSFTLPDRITIFQGPHERVARSQRHLEELVEETVWHEVGHYFGMDEARVRRALRRIHARNWPPGRR